MASLQIRNLPDDVYQALQFRAERAHRSLAQQAIVELRAVTADVDLRRARALERIKRRISEKGIEQAARDPEDLIREDRER